MKHLWAKSLDESRSKPALQSNISILITNDNNSSTEIKSTLQHFSVCVCAANQWNILKMKTTGGLSPPWRWMFSSHTLAMPTRSRNTWFSLWRERQILYKSLRIHWIQQKGPEPDTEKASLARLEWFGCCGGSVGVWVTCWWDDPTLQSGWIS